MLEENPPSPPQGTPHPTPSHSHPLHLQSSLAEPLLPHEMINEEEGQVYGTSINVNEIKGKLQRFLLQFQELKKVGQEMVSETVYVNRLSEMECDEGHMFDVDGRHLKEYDLQLYLNLLYSPAQLLVCFDEVVKGLFQKYFIQAETNEYTKKIKVDKKSKMMVRLTNLAHQQLQSLKQLTPIFLGRLVYIRGLVVRESEIFPQMKTAHFSCTHCKHTVNLPLENARVKEPERCPSCRKGQTFELISNLCEFTDKQYIKMQELPELVGDGESPQSINLIAYDSNVDMFRPGQRIEVIGIYRATPFKIDKMRSIFKTVFNTYLDIISSNRLDGKQTRIDNTLTFSDEDIRTITRMADRIDENGKSTVISDLVNSFAPSIHKNTQVKKGILTQLFGGTKKELGSVGRTHFRSDINILLLGDPSTAKSQLLQHVVKIAPRCIYTNGRGASAVGLTANVRKDPETREFVLESGALVMSDQGLCCIDEFDKMEQNSRVVLLEAMEQQTLSIAKAGVVCQLNSRAAILAAANPKESKYQTDKSVVENINLPPNLLSRFDLLYILLDVANQVNDRSIAAHILELYMPSKITEYGTISAPMEEQCPLEETVNEKKKKPMIYSTEQLVKYISYARQHVHPTISPSAGQRIIKEYTDMRSFGRSKNTISATPRQLESMIRISQAFARMRLSQEVEEDDVEEASQLIRAATLASSTDPDTGVVDMGILTTGNSTAVKQRRQELARSIGQHLMANTSKYRLLTPVRRFYDQTRSLLTYRPEKEEQDKYQYWLQAMMILQSEDVIVMMHNSKKNAMFKLSHDALEYREYS